MTNPTPQLGSARRKGSPYPKAEVSNRLIAKAADLLVAVLFAYFIPTVGTLIGLVFLLLADALPNGQSPGKRLMGVKAVHVPTQRSCNHGQSVVRNLPIAIAFAIVTNPFLIVVALAITLFEIYMVMTDVLGVRIGDIFADTQVIDGKVPVDAVLPATELVRSAKAQEVVGPAEVQIRKTSEQPGS